MILIDEVSEKGQVMISERMQTATLNDAPAYWFLNAVHILLAKSESEGGTYSLLHLTVPPQFSTPYHVHHTEDEAFYVLEGELIFICDGDKIARGAGSYIFLPRGVPHGSRSSGEGTSRVLIHVMPRGPVGFIGMMLEMATPIRQGVLPTTVPPDLAKLDALCKKNKIDILGALPA